MNLMTHNEDHFSRIALQYVRGRMGYPEELYDFLRAQCSGADLAWDCATGSGQAAIDLARRFSKVIATDISGDLLALAPSHPEITFRKAAAEDSQIESNSVDLITVAQAVHWFDLPEFWREAVRVLHQGGVLALWGYNWPVVSERIDHVLEGFKVVLAPWWPERSAILHEGYSSISPPLSELHCPAFAASAVWDINDYLSHLRSWSATRYHREGTGVDLTDTFRSWFEHVWPDDRVEVRWPLVFRAFRK